MVLATVWFEIVLGVLKKRDCAYSTSLGQTSCHFLFSFHSLLYPILYHALFVFKEDTFVNVPQTVPAVCILLVKYKYLLLRTSSSVRRSLDKSAHICNICSFSLAMVWVQNLPLKISSFPAFLMCVSVCM